MMAQKVEPVAHADELAELWDNLLRCQRGALLVLSYVDLDLESRRWQDLPTDARMRLVRSMRALTELAVDCAVTLERAKVALERAAPPTVKEQLLNDVAEYIDFPGGGAAMHDAWVRGGGRRRRS